MANINDCDNCTYPELLAAANARVAELEAIYRYCPECGSKNIFTPSNFTEKGHLACKDCGQEFFTTVVYADCIAENLSKAKQCAEKAEAKLEVQTETALQEKAKREQAEAQCAVMRNCIKRLIYVIDSTPECFRAIDKTTEYLWAQDFADDVKTTAGTDILTRMKRMEDALKEIAEPLIEARDGNNYYFYKVIDNVQQTISAKDLQKIAKDTLEEK